MSTFEAMTDTAAATANDMYLAARAAGLRYVNPADPGISRVKRGKGFAFVDASGKAVSDEATLSRIRSLVIPPAWTEVWICASPNGHIQATGRDAKGRLQYRYHANWGSVRDETKYERTIAFARALPRLRRRVRRDLARRGLPREKVLAAVVRLLEMTMVRVGNEEYARQNKSFGLTTLRDRHAKVRGSELKLTFRGKAGKDHSVGVRDRRIARIVKQSQDLPGQRLFQYVDENGDRQAIDSDDVNQYLRDAMGDEFSAKDFRTWAGTVLAARAFQALEAATGDERLAEAAASGTTNRGRASLTRAVEEVAQQLGNTPAVCRRCYIHPQIIDAYLDGSLAQSLTERAADALETDTGLRAEERFVLSLLRRRLAADNRRAVRAARSTAKSERPTRKAA
jgi:DNA topoisomerase-1